MAGKNESTATWRLDIAQLKSGMQDAKRAISLANAEFKNAVAGMDDWSKTATGLEAKITQLNKNYDNQSRILDDLKEQYKITAENLGENSAEAQRLAVQMNNQEAAMKKTDAALTDYMAQLIELKGEAKFAETAYSKLTQEIGQQESELDQLKAAYVEAVVNFGKTSSEANELASKISGLSSDLVENRGKLEDAERAAHELSGVVDDAGDSAEDAANGGFTVLKGALADLVSNGIQYVAGAFKDMIGGIDGANAKFQAQTGASAAEMDEFADAMKNVYEANYGESLEDVGDKMAYIKQVTGETDPSNLEQLTKNAIALEDTFGSDFNETIRGVNNLMEHFGIDSETAFDLFAKGSQNGLDYTDELGDNIAEYGGNFAQAGYSAQEYFQLLENGTQGGAYNLDKVNDSINEVKNRLGDGTIEKNIGMFSDGTQDLFDKWSNGETDMKTVINSIVSDISNCTDEQDALSMAATAFGTMGEDANLDVVKSLTTLGDSYKDTKGTMEELNNVRYGDLTSQLQEIKRTFETEVIAPLVDRVLPVLKDQIVPVAKDAIGWIRDNLPTIGAAIAGVVAAMAAANIVTMVQGVVKAFQAWKLATDGMTLSQRLLNLAMAANPIMLIVSLIAGLVAALVTLYMTNEDFRNKVIEVWGAVKDFLSDAIATIGEFFTVTLPNAIKVMINWFKQIPGKVGAFFSQALSRATKWASSMATKAREAGSKFLNNVVNFVKSIPGKVWTYLSNTVDKAASFAKSFAKKGTEAAKDFFTNVKNKISELPGEMLSIGKNIVSGIWQGISNGTTWIKNQITGWVGNVKSFIKNLFGIKSPSRVMRDEVGKYIARGIAVGIIGETKSVEKAITKIGETALKAVENGAFSKTGEAAAKSLTNSVADSLKADKAKVTARIDTYFADMENAAKKAQKKATAKYDRQIKKLEAARKNTSSKSEKASLEKRIKSLDDQRKKIAAKYDANIKEINAVYKQFGKNVSKSYASAIDKATKGITDGLSDKIKSISSETQKSIDAVNAKISSMQEKMTGYGDMFTRGFFNKIRLSDLDQQTEAIEHYYTNLEALRKKASAALVTVVQEMDINDSIDFADTLLKMSDDEFKTYQESFTKKQNAAKNSAKAFYAGEVDNIKNSYTKQVTAAVDNAAKEIESLGKDALKGFMKGMKSVKYEKDVKKLCKGIVKSMKKQLKIKSPSRVFAELGEFSGLGYIEGLADSLQGVSATMGGAVDAISGNVGGVSGAANGGNVTKTQNVTFNQYNNSPKALSRLDIYRDTKSLFFNAKVGMQNV